MSYYDDFIRAVDRTRRFGLEVPRGQLETSSRWLDAQGLDIVARVVSEAFTGLTARDLVAQCVNIHLELAPILADALRCDVWPTIGGVAYDQEPEGGLYLRAEAAYRDNLEGRNLEAFNLLHMWLTLPSMEVLDFTLMASLVFAQDLDRTLAGRPITRHADELEGMRYVPMLVGDSYVRALGERHGRWMMIPPAA